MATTLTVLLVGEPEKDTFIVVAIDRAGHELHHPFAHRPHEVDTLRSSPTAKPRSEHRCGDGCGEWEVLVLKEVHYFSP